MTCKQQLGSEEERFIDDIGETLETVQPTARFPWEQVLGFLVARHGRAGVLEMFRNRIAMGQETYGELDFVEGKDRERDFVKELCEELVDAVVYDWCEFRRDEVTP